MSASQTPPRIGQPWPAEPAGIYAGITRGPDGQPDQHLLLSPTVAPGRMTWREAMAWAAQLAPAGTWSLPTRAEAALLFANLRDQFDLALHWTDEAEGRSCAWGQHFNHGNQYDDRKSFKGCARAVRSIPAQSFNPSERQGEA